jgi:hypothetical protein
MRDRRRGKVRRAMDVAYVADIMTMTVRVICGCCLRHLKVRLFLTILQRDLLTVRQERDSIGKAGQSYILTGGRSRPAPTYTLSPLVTLASS